MSVAHQSAVERAGKVFALVKQAAERGEECPGSGVLAERLGCGVTAIARYFDFLKANGMVEVRAAAGIRVVTICATGKTTRARAKVTVPKRNRRHGPARNAARIAGLVADGSTIAAAGRQLGITPKQAEAAWKQVRQDLGWQAV